MKEAIIQKWVRKQLQDRFDESCIYIKYPASQYSSKGVADLIFCIMGQYIAIEVKTYTGELTALQRLFLQRVRSAGGLAYVIYGKDQDLIEGIICEIEYRGRLGL